MILFDEKGNQIQKFGVKAKDFTSIHFADDETIIGFKYKLRDDWYENKA